MRRLTILSLAAAFAVVSIGCSTAANTNLANKAVMNSNSLAVVVNNNSNMVTMNSNMVSSNRWNANMTREEYDRDKDRYSTEAKTAGSTVGSGLNDGWIWTKTKSALAASNDLRDSTINVDVDNAVITLRGTVATAAQKTQAETVAKGIDGQKGIKNQITVQAGDTMSNQMTGGNSNMRMTNANK